MELSCGVALSNTTFYLDPVKDARGKITKFRHGYKTCSLQALARGFSFFADTSLETSKFPTEKTIS